MSAKRFDGEKWVDLTNCKRFDGEKWVDLTTCKRFDGEKWVDLTDSSTGTETDAQIHTKTYRISSAQIYWGSGNKDNQSGSVIDLIVGSHGGTKATARRTLMFFPLSEIRSDLADASIEKVEMYLHRRNTSHGNAGSNLHVKTATYSSAPNTWTGTDSGAADSGTPTFMRGQGKWITLLNSVGEGLRDGTIKSLALDADTNYDMSAYGRYVRSEAKLRITYKK